MRARSSAIILSTFLLGASAPAALHAPNGTYDYKMLVGVNTLLTSKITITDDPGGFTVRESATKDGSTYTIQSSFDGRGHALEHSLTFPQAGRIMMADARFGDGVLTLKDPPATFRALPGTTIMGTGENLVSFYVLAPLYARLTAGKPFTYVALNGGNVLQATATAASDVRPAQVKTGDLEVALTLGSRRANVWYDPQTQIVEYVDLQSLTIQLEGRAATPTVSSEQTPTPQRTPVPLPSPTYAQREVRFRSIDGAQIGGVLEIPKHGRNLVPAIAFVHGSGAGTRDGGTHENPTFLDLGNALGNRGVAVLRYDKRGIGASSGVAATEDLRALSGDARAAVAFLRKQPGVDPRRIYLLGHSEGGFIVPAVANASPVRGIILLAPPAISMERILAKQGLASMSPAQQSVYKTMFASYIGIDPRVILGRVRKPVLLVQGTKDSQVLLTDFQRLAAIKNRPKGSAVVVLPGDDHLFNVLPPSQPAQETQDLFIPRPLDPRVPAAILQWIKLLAG